VDGYIFRLPRIYFDQSETSRKMFPLPPASQPRDVSEGDAILLEGVTRDGFEAFLRVLIPLWEFDPIEPMTGDEWLQVLNLAQKWDFPKIRRIAIDELNKHPIEVVLKIHIAQLCGVTEWLIPSFKALAQRENPLTMMDVELLGTETASKITRVRLLVKHKIEDNDGGNISEADCEAIIRDVFGNIGAAQ
ncbi:hypothetical protein BD410DRAFT_719886, partial [Rickenella mellea]